MLKFVDAIAEKSLRSTAVMTAARGRGKSAALGLAMASAVAFGYVALCCNLYTSLVVLTGMWKFSIVKALAK